MRVKLGKIGESVSQFFDDKNAVADEAAKKSVLPWLVAVALFMESLDMTILNTAVPSIANALEVSPLSMKAALTSYTISLAVFIPISGWIADRFGTRIVFFCAIAIFALSSLFCGFALNMPMLVAGRIAQGVGGALMTPVGRITLVRTFQKSELLQAMNFVAVPALIGPLIGPLAGGIIVTHTHWRMIFFVNLPVALAGLYLVYYYMPNYREEKTVPLDTFGAVLFGSGIALLSYVLEIFGEHTLSLTSELFLLLLSGILLFAYARHASGEEFPLLRMTLFRIRTFRISVVGSLITRLGVGGTPFLLPLLYQIGLGYTPVQSGLLIIPQPLAAMTLKMISPWVLTTFGYRRVLLFNTVMIGAMIMLFATVGLSTPTWLIVVQAAALGFFSSLQYTCMNSLTYSDLSKEQSSAGASIASTVQQMSMSFGVAVASLVTAYFLEGLSHEDSAQMLSGLHRSLIVMGTITVTSALMFRGLREEDGAAVSRHHVKIKKEGIVV